MSCRPISESDFINAEYSGAQPMACLPSPAGATGAKGAIGARGRGATIEFDGHDILAVIDAAGESAGIITLAPELEGALDLIRHLVARAGRRVSLGHSGAALERSRAAIAAGARHATHLFNRMPPLGHREPGLAGAILTSGEVAAGIICDGVPRPSRHGAHGPGRERRGPRHGDYRWRGRGRFAGWGDGNARRPDDPHEREAGPISRTGRSPAAWRRWTACFGFW